MEISEEKQTKNVFVSPDVEALSRKINLLQVKPMKLLSTLAEILGWVKILEQQNESCVTEECLWLERVERAAIDAILELDFANDLIGRADENAEVQDSVILSVGSRFDSLLEERKGLSKIQSEVFDDDELLVVFESREVVGRDSEIEWISNWVIKKEDAMQQQHVSTLSLYGEEGIGKTSLARLIFDDEKVMKHFRVRAWASATWDEVDLVNIARGIVGSATGLSCHSNDLAELDNVVRDILESTRALIVLDNVELMEQNMLHSLLHMLHSWFNVLDSGSRIILISSRKEEVRIADEQLKLRRLPHDASWSLFSSMAFDAFVFDENYASIADNAKYLVRARAIAARCFGNPRLLKIWGTLLRLRRDEAEYFLTKHLDPSNGVPDMLRLSYLGLPDALKKCLGFCTLYPKGYMLKKDSLIQMWTAHGLILPFRFREERALENAAVACFQQLLPFFEDFNWNKNGDIIECRLPGLVHALIEDVAGIASQNEAGIKSRVNKNGSETYLEFITESLTMPLTSNIDAEHLRTLLVSGKLLDNFSSSISKLKSLTVLDLSCTGILKLSSCIGTLKQLKYLDLSHTLIKKLPDSITNIFGLQTLKLSGCLHLRTLPSRMQSLINLRHLEMQLCDSLLYLPSGIGKLTSLQSMPSFVLSQEEECARLSELQNMKQLKGKLAIKNLENVRSCEEARDAKLQEKKGLEHLSFSWSTGKDGCSKMPSNTILECLFPPPKLKSLDVDGYMSDEFPSWVQSINSLTKVSIRDCGCVVLPPLGQLPNLKELYMEGMFKLVSIGQEFYGDSHFASGFYSLEQIEFRDMPLLLDWSSALPWQEPGSSSSTRQAFPCLKSLTVEGCPKLRGLPHLPALDSLVISNSNNKLLSSLSNISSLSSLVINNVLVKDSFENLENAISVDKLILHDCGELDPLLKGDIKKFTSLAHLVIFSCHDLKYLETQCLSSLHKLDIVDCRNLRRFEGIMSPQFSLKELIIDGCPALESLPNGIHHLTSLEKLIIKRCTELSSLPEGELEMLSAVKYLSISECPMLKKRLQRDTSEELLNISGITPIII